MLLEWSDMVDFFTCGQFEIYNLTFFNLCLYSDVTLTVFCRDFCYFRFWLVSRSAVWWPRRFCFRRIVYNTDASLLLSNCFYVDMQLTNCPRDVDARYRSHENFKQYTFRECEQELSTYIFVIVACKSWIMVVRNSHGKLLAWFFF